MWYPNRLPSSPFSSIEANTENFLCASHPIKCSISRCSSFQAGVLSLYDRTRCSAFIGSLCYILRMIALLALLATALAQQHETIVVTGVYEPLAIDEVDLS